MNRLSTLFLFIAIAFAFDLPTLGRKKVKEKIPSDITHKFALSSYDFRTAH